MLASELCSRTFDIVTVLECKPDGNAPRRALGHRGLEDVDGRLEHDFEIAICARPLAGNDRFGPIVSRCGCHHERRRFPGIVCYGRAKFLGRLDADDPDSEVAVSGHSANSLVVNTVVFDTLQDDLIWTVDDKGYNFKHTIDVSSAQAFDTAGLFYRVRYNLTPVSGQVIVVRFKLKAI